MPAYAASYRCVLALYVCLHLAPEVAAASIDNKVVATVVAGVISLGLFELSVSYYKASVKAASMEETVRVRLGSGTPMQTDALRWLHEYQVARSGWPLIPTVVWRLRRDDLNILWRDFGSQPASGGKDDRTFALTGGDSIDKFSSESRREWTGAALGTNRD